ncbi:hypothetical protein DRB96_02110 [Streptomyces sp. ICC1]|nr:hypothetical protein DRB89_00770 [Streptomyces sp. ICC4]AWZ11317.1 hypothetical protein DRB96_02110 [Streptomyces sp. ICC1]
MCGLIRPVEEEASCGSEASAASSRATPPSGRPLKDLGAADTVACGDTAFGGETDLCGYTPRRGPHGPDRPR